MKFQQGDEYLELWVDGYEVQDSKQSNVAESDLNWLVLGFSYGESGGQPRVETDACLTTGELSALIDALWALADGRLRRYESDFLEPILRLELTVKDGAPGKFRLALRYLSGRPEGEGFAFLNLTETLDAARLAAWRAELTEARRAFPRR